VILFQQGPQLDAREGLSRYQLDQAALQPVEDARADAGDKGDPELLKVRIAAEGFSPNISSGRGERQSLGENGRLRVEVLFP
jgi:hypothetical protein